MFHDRALAVTTADPRPASAVSHGCGMAGLAGLLVWVGLARHFGMDGPYAALVDVAACGLPMVSWAVLIDRVHRAPSTGIDWSHPRPWRETIDLSLTKLAGLWVTWAGIALIYATLRFYWQGRFAFSMWCFGAVAPWLFALSIPYVIWLDRRLVAPKDGAWMLGAWLMGIERTEPASPIERTRIDQSAIDQSAIVQSTGDQSPIDQSKVDHGSIDHAAIFNHLRSWGVKAFFLAFMLAIVPPGYGDFIRGDTGRLLHDPVALSSWLITFMFMIDVAFATVGYVLTLRPLDSHIRSANPFAASWMAALICYPPFILMGDGGLLDYHPGTADWTHWFAGHPLLLGLTGAVLVGLTAIYAWATIAFGFRFSNLTNRGILTHGPYALTRHPAYLSKNLFWWLSTLPVLTTGSLVDAARATILMGVVSAIYFWRAKTEERHLGLDPDYRLYSAWIARRGAVPRLLGWLAGHRG